MEGKHHYLAKTKVIGSEKTSKICLEQPDSDSVFIFIHGFASGPDDLLPLAKTFYSRGYHCELVILKGHGTDNAEDLKPGCFFICIRRQ